MKQNSCSIVGEVAKPTGVDDGLKLEGIQMPPLPFAPEQETTVSPFTPE
jgi:hypothetical protein